MATPKPHLRKIRRIDQDLMVRKGYLRLDMNESVSGLSQDFIDSILPEIDSAILASYPYYKALIEKVAAYNKIQPENICLSNGSDGAIKYLFDAYVFPGDKILLTEPTFAMYPLYCEMFNAQSIIVGYNSDFSFCEKCFMERITPKIKIAILVNPNNPTGSAIREEILINIIRKAENNGVILIVDEAYFYFYNKTVIEQVRNYSNLVVLRTFSKLCGLASVRFGYAAAPPHIIENLIKVKPTFDVNGLAVLFAEKILDNPGIINTLINSVNNGKRYLLNKLCEKGIEYREGCANFILIKCFQRVNEIIGKLKEKNILVKGNFKQPFLKDYIRVTVGDEIYMRKFWESFIDIWEVNST